MMPSWSRGAINNYMEYRELKEKKTFTVTGGAGFIGSNIVLTLLGLGQKVNLLDDMSTGRQANLDEIAEYVKTNNIPAEDYKYIAGDIRDLDACKEAVKGADYVMHNAALGSVPRSVEDPIPTNDVNISGTLNMLVAARDSGVKRFSYASSSAIYGDAQGLPKKEGDEGSPLSPYAVTKAVNELYANNFQFSYGLEVVGLRYFNIFGPRQDPFSQYAAVIPIFVKSIMEGNAPTINGDGETSRDFTFVDNAVQANIRACLAPSEATGRAYNIACGGRFSLNQLYDKLCSLLGSDLKPIYGPERAGDVRHSEANISDAEKFLGFKPEVGFYDGLEKSIGWYKENL